MPEKIGRWSVGLERRHPVTMLKASFKTQHHTGEQYSAVEETKNRAVVHSVLAPAPHPKPSSRLRSVKRVDSLFVQCLETRAKRE